MENMNIDEQIAFLTKKADDAQKSGNYEAMKEYDRQIQILQKQKMEIFKKMIDESNEVKEENSNKNIK